MTALFPAPPPPRTRRQLVWTAFNRGARQVHSWNARAFHGAYTIQPCFHPDRPWRRGDGFKVRYEPDDPTVDDHLPGFGAARSMRDARRLIADHHADRLRQLLGEPPCSARHRSRPSRRSSAAKSRVRSAREAYNALLQRSLRL